MTVPTQALLLGRPNDPLAKLQAGSHAKATRRVACRDYSHVGRSDLQAT